uniref:phosphoketolase family protein n=1 Tax=Nocardia stercoris TaxID=2483361 RepID=UPI001F1F5291|nr:hypothetical protein [Nocardia stercoris]
MNNAASHQDPGFIDHVLSKRPEVARVYLPPDANPHGIPDIEYVAMFGPAPVVFAFHGYPWLIHQLTYRRHGHHLLHVHGFRDNGTTTTPSDMCALNGIDRYQLAMTAVEHVPRLSGRAGTLLAMLAEKLDAALAYTRQTGEDLPEMSDWRWPGGTAER